MIQVQVHHQHYTLPKYLSYKCKKTPVYLEEQLTEAVFLEEQVLVTEAVLLEEQLTEAMHSEEQVKETAYLEE